MAAASLGARSDAEWDVVVPLSGPAREDLAFWLANTEPLAALRMPMLVPTTTDVERLWEELAPEYVLITPVQETLPEIGGVYRRAAGLRFGHVFYMQVDGQSVIWFIPSRASSGGSWCVGRSGQVIEPREAEALTQAHCRCDAEVSLSPVFERGPWRLGPPSSEEPGPTIRMKVVSDPRAPLRLSMPPVLSSFRSRFRGRLVTDAGPNRWGATLTKSSGEVLHATSTYDEEDVRRGDTLQQPWREGLAVISAVRAFAAELAGGVALHHSDCECVVRAIQKGSVTSEVLQKQARRLWQECARLGILFYSGWVPGKEVVRLGADALSREGGCDVSDVRTGPTAGEGIRRLCRARSWTLTIDLFASTPNAVVPRFCAGRHAGAEEQVDAFTKPSWSYLDCRCGAKHEEIVYAFPPDPILLPVWSRLRRDGAKGIALAPHWVSAPWWSILKSGAVGDLIHVPGADLRIGDVGSLASSMRDRYNARSYVLLAFDFSRPAAPCAPPCEQVGVVRRSEAEVGSAAARTQLLMHLSEAVSAVKRHA